MIPSTSSGATTTPEPVSRIELARPRRPAERRPGSGGRPRCTRTPSPRARPCRGRRRRGRAGAAPRSRAGSAATRHAAGSRRARGGRRGRATRPTRGPSSGSRRRSARRRRGRRRWNACRNGRGSRFPKKLPVCVIRKRAAGAYSSPAKSSKSQPFAIDADRVRARRGSRTSSAIASETQRDRVGAARDEPRDLLVRGLARPRRGGVVTPVLVRDERIAEIGDPARAGRAAGRRRRRSGPTVAATS